jgi:hypothetical protein
METIIGILFLLLPVILKVIGKKFEQSGATENARRIREIAETFTEESPDIDEDELEEKPVRILFEEKPAQTAPETASPFSGEGLYDVKKPVRRPARKAEEPKQEKKEKIDPKKLVLYSEIMKPKF